MKKQGVKLRLKFPHYLNGIKKRAGSVVRLDKFSADFLMKRRGAVLVK